MHQGDLWSTAPVPTGLDSCVSYVASTDDYYLTFYLHFSKAKDGNKVHTIHLVLELDELDVVPYLTHTAHKHFWRDRPPRQVEREVMKHLRSYRAAAVTTPALVNGFRAVDFG